MHKPTVIALFSLLVGTTWAAAGEICSHSKAPCHCAQPACAGESQCGPGVAYEERQVICYKTVFEEVKEQVPVNATKFVPATEYRMVPLVCPQPPAPCGEAACGAAGAVAASGGCGETCGPCPQPCLQKVPVEVLREVPYTKMVEKVRLVEKHIPYTVTCYIAHPVSGCVEGCGPVPAAPMGAAAGAPTLAPKPVEKK